MSLTRILAITQRIIRQFKHDKRTLGLLFIVPLVVISILGPLLTVDPVLNIGVINNDETGQAIKFSTKIINNLEDQEKTNVKTIKQSEISKSLRDGAVIAVVTLPKDFSKLILSGKSAKLPVEVDGSNPSRAQGTIAKIQQALASQGKAGARPKLDIDYKYGGEDFDNLDYAAPSFIAFFAFFFVFLLTSVSFLRERGQGTIERLMASPASRFEIILGYLLGFSIFAIFQVAIILLYTIFVLKINYIGDVATVFFVVLLLTLVSVNLGIFLSSFAANELQVIQFIPIVILPQGLLSGIIFPVEDLPRFLQSIAQILPLTHAIDALQKIMLKGFSLKDVSSDILFLIVLALLMLVLSTLTIKRKIA